MSAQTKSRNFLAQFLVALGRTSPAYVADPGSGRSPGRQFLAALGRRSVAVQHADDLEAASLPSVSPTAVSVPAPSDQVGNSAVADLLWSLPPAIRLSLRSHPAVLSIALTSRTQLALALALALADDLAHPRDPALSLARAHLDTLAKVFGRAGASDLTDSAVGIAHALDRDRFRARAHAFDLIRDLDRDLDRARVRTLGLARAFALDLDGNLALALDRDLDHSRSRAIGRALALDRDRAVRRAQARSEALDRARNGFTGADLRDVDLAGVDLTGVRWSRSTQWPGAWIDEVASLSIEIEPGIFEVQGGTIQADLPSDLVGV